MKLPNSKTLLFVAPLALLIGSTLIDQWKTTPSAKSAPLSVIAQAQHRLKNQHLFSWTKSNIATGSDINAATPAPLDSPSEQELKDFPGARVIECAEIDDPDSGDKIRMRVLETGFKYPYVRTEEMIDPEDGSLLGRAEMAADHFLLTLPEGTNPQDVLNDFGPEVLSLQQIAPNSYMAQLSSPSLEGLATVLWEIDSWLSTASTGAEPDYFCQFNDPSSNGQFDGNQWALSKIAAPAAWNIRSSAAPIIVAVIDTGIRYTHDDLKGNMWRNPMPVSGDLYGTNAIAGTGDPMDDCGHGTHCAGIIGAVGINKGVSGVARNVQLMACKYMDAQGKGMVSDEVACLDYATDHGAKVFNCSYGVEIGFRKDGYSVSTPFSLASKVEHDAMQRARNKGVIIVAAAGNNDTSNDQHPTYPASYDLDNIVAVAATDDQDQLCSFSNYGAKSVHLGAPGFNILSTWGYSDDAYTYLSGTSMATPHVVGALALMAAQFPNLSHQELIARLLATTDKLASLQGKTTSGGRLNLLKALSQ